MNKLAVMQLTDTLEAGGAERVAVNLANSLSRDRFVSHLCTTWWEGPLADEVAPDVQRLNLARRGRFDIGAIRALLKYNREHKISILHAHGCSVFIGIAASLFPPHPSVIWHVHYGRLAAENRFVLPYRIAAKRITGAIAVNRELADWCQRRLRMTPGQVSYIPNFVYEIKRPANDVDLPGFPGRRIVNLANIRREKDQLSLIRAMVLVVQDEPTAHLLLVGAANDEQYFAALQDEVRLSRLNNNVTFLGMRSDVGSILGSCDIGVLSSVSEGLPMALLEYGAAGLPVVATRVGQCAEVLSEGATGLIVSPGNIKQLADSLLLLLRSKELRSNVGNLYRQRVSAVYGTEAIVERICAVYGRAVSTAQEGKSTQRPVGCETAQ
jgi:glycosyltransferase involved in cell wall biosynthesis